MDFFCTTKKKKEKKIKSESTSKSDLLFCNNCVIQLNSGSKKLMWKDDWLIFYLFKAFKVVWIFLFHFDFLNCQGVFFKRSILHRISQRFRDIKMCGSAGYTFYHHFTHDCLQRQHNIAAKRLFLIHEISFPFPLTF